MARWFGTGNQATGFIAVGNIATGVFAFGNVARGFVAVGNVAVGVVAFGNVGCGILVGGGATVGIGMGAFSAILAFPVVADAGFGMLTMTDASPALGILPVLFWGLLSLVLRGEPPPLPERPVLTTLARLRGGQDAEGWVAARIDRVDGDTVRARVGSESLGIDAETHDIASDAAAVAALGPAKALLRLAVVERIADEAHGYREAPPTEKVLSCREARAMPPSPRIWETPANIQWGLAWAWRFGAAAGAVLWAVQLVS